MDRGVWQTTDHGATESDFTEYARKHSVENNKAWCSNRGNGNPFQYACLENFMDRVAWRAIVHRFAKSWTWQTNTHFCACMLGCFSRVWLLVTLWTATHQAPLSMGFSRQEYWSGGAISFSSSSSWPRDWTCVSYISCISRKERHRVVEGTWPRWKFS